MSCRFFCDMSTIERAIEIALRAHAGQTDKAGAPYILHPLRLMLRMPTPPEMMIAVLHDVVEDSAITLGDLRQEGFSDEVIDAVSAVTRREGESYEAFVLRAAANPLGAKVKLADLEDNMDLLRLQDLGDRDLERLKRYHRAWTLLKGTEEEIRTETTGRDRR